MKFLVSSSLLAKKLSEIDFDTDSVKVASYNIDSKTLTILTDKHSIDIKVFKIGTKPPIKNINQSNRRWDFLKEIVSKANTQPVIIEVTETTLDVTFQY